MRTGADPQSSFARGRARRGATGPSATGPMRTGADSQSSIPAGRVRRTAKVGGLLGGEIARAYATRAANLVRSREDRSAAGGRRRLQAADHIVEVLGQMKGPAM